MKQRPITLTIFSIMLLMIGLSFPFQIMFQYGYSILEFLEAFCKLTYLNGLVAMLCFLNIYFLRRAHRFSIILFLITLLTVTFNNYVVGLSGLMYSLWQTHIASLLFASLGLFFLDPQVLKLFKNPELRWWLPEKRVPIKVFAEINVLRGKPLKAKTEDISKTGVYLNLPEKDLQDSFVKTGDLVDIYIYLDQLKHIKCSATVVRKSMNHQGKPPGVGLEFLFLDRSSKKLINEVISSF